MKSIIFESAQHVKVEFELASTFQRVAAALIDITAFFIYFLIVMAALGLGDFFSSAGTRMFVILLIIKLPWILYFPLVEFFMKGQSLGKYALGIRIVTIDGESPGLKEVFTRWLFRGDFFWISADALVLIWAGIGVVGAIFSATSPKGQRLGDVMAGTVVIKNNASVKYSYQQIDEIKNNENYTAVYPNVIRLTDEDMLLIKNTILRVQKYPNNETKNFAIQLANKSAELIGLEETPPQRLQFLQTLLQDYIVLTRS